jgi:PAS domain S-box-containing protein
MPLSDNQKETELFRYPAADTECAILLFDADGVIKYSNPEIINYLSIEAYEIVGQVVFGLFPDFPIDEYLKQAQNKLHIFRWDNSSQQSIFEIIVIPLYLDTCNYFLMELYSVHDVNEKLNKFKDVSEFSNEAITITDTNGVIEYANPVFMELTGFSKDQVIGHTHSILKSGIHEPGFYLEMWATLLAGKSFRGQFVNRRPDGTLFYEDKIIRPFYNTQGVLSHFISSGRDVSDKVQIMHRLEHLANHDCLTGLPNRIFFWTDCIKSKRGVRVIMTDLPL